MILENDGSAEFPINSNIELEEVLPLLLIRGLVVRKYPFPEKSTAHQSLITIQGVCSFRLNLCQFMQ